VILRYQQRKNATQQALITVPQAWLWKIDNIIATVLPLDFQRPCSLSKNMQYSWSFVEFANPEEILGLFLSDLVDVLDRPGMAGLSEPVFNIFQKAIAGLSEEVNSYMKSADVDTIKIEKEKEFLHTIDDIREELSMIKTVLFQQEEVWKDFASKAWPQCWSDGPDGQFKLSERPEDKDRSEQDMSNERHRKMSDERYREMWNKIQRPQIQFAKFKRRIAKLDGDAERVERAIDRKLDLKTKHASLNEAHTMAIMSAAVFGFTIITIIFTPLSFIVALFALPIDRFQQHQVQSIWTNQAGMYSTNYVGKWIGENIRSLIPRVLMFRSNR
jgi:tetrahydromethanopterin S-methyltransferase subunit B